MSRRAQLLLLAAVPFAIYACVGSNPELAPGADAAPDPLDSGTIGDASNDVRSLPMRPCDPTAPFGAGRPIGGLSNGGGLRLSPDELTTYFAGNDGQLYVAARGSLDADFAPATPLSSLNTTQHEVAPTVTADGLMIVFQRSPTASDPNADLLYAQRSSVLLPFEAPMFPPTFNRTAFEGSPYLRPDGKALYWARFLSTTDSDIRRSPGDYDAGIAPAFGTGLTLAELDSPVVEISPVVSPDELRIFWASNRTDGALATSGGLDIYTASRSVVTAAFGDLTKLNVLDTAAAELPSWVSPDGCRLYFDRNSGGGSVPLVSERGVP